MLEKSTPRIATLELALHALQQALLEEQQRNRLLQATLKEINRAGTTQWERANLLDQQVQRQAHELNLLRVTLKRIYAHPSYRALRTLRHVLRLGRI